jgi:hypothetical protein
MAAEMLTIKVRFDKLPARDIENQHKKMRDEFEETAGVFEDEMTEAAVNVKKQWKEQLEDFDWSHPFESSKRVIGAWFDTFIRRTGILAGLLFAVIGAFIKRFLDLVAIQPRLTKMFSMLESQGVSMAKSVGNAMNDITDIVLDTGAALGDVTDIYVDLGQARVPTDDLKELTKMAYLGAKALGANQEQLNEMISGLKVMGRLSNDQIGSMIKAFGNVQTAIGLTQSEMSNLIQTVNKLTQYLAGLDASADTIERVGKEAALMTGVFGALGLEAGRAGEIMSGLFDPTRLAQNAFLISQMGMNMSEYQRMLAGGAEGQIELTEGLIKAAKRVKLLADRGSTLQASLLAQKMGFRDLTEATRLATEGMEKLREVREKAREKAPTLEQQAADAMANLGEVVKRFKNIFMGAFAKLAIPILEKLTAALSKQLEGWITNENKLKAFTEGLIKWLKPAIEWIMKNLTVEKIKEFGKNVVEWFKKVGEWFRKVGKTISFLIDNWALLIPIIGTLIAILPLFGQAIGKGLAKGLDSLGKVSPMALAAVVVLTAAFIGMAFAVKLLSQAVEPFKENMMPLVIGIGLIVGAIVALAAVAALLSLLGAQIIVGAAAILVLAAAILVLVTAFRIFVGALNAMQKIGPETFEIMAEGMKTLATALAEAAPAMVIAGAAMVIFGPALGIVALAALGLAKAFEMLEPRVDKVGEQLLRFKDTAKLIRPLKPELKAIGAGFRDLAKGVNQMNLRKLSRTVSHLDAFGKGIKNIAAAIKELNAIDISEDFVNRMKVAQDGLAKIASVKGVEEKAGGFLGGLVKGVQSLFGGGLRARITPVVAGSPDMGELDGAGRAEVRLTRVMQVKMDNVVEAIREEFEMTREAEQERHNDRMAAAEAQYNELRRMRRTAQIS